MSQLVPCINRLTEVNAREMAIEEKDSKSLSVVRREEAEKTREHKKYTVTRLFSTFKNQAIRWAKLSFPVPLI